MCECMKEMNAVLEKHNGRLAMGLQVTPDMGIKGRYLMATEKIDKTKRTAPRCAVTARSAARSWRASEFVTPNVAIEP